mmetsp:Transcript_602/g.1326  ORF Transcript_602/g.1326 Transcript_602/m.1326 type:complete len:259 (-) Transcript_602:1160-1936(-)
MRHEMAVANVEPLAIDHLPRVCRKMGVRGMVTRADGERLRQLSARARMPIEQVHQRACTSLTTKVEFEYGRTLLDPRHLNRSAVAQRDDHVALRCRYSRDELVDLLRQSHVLPIKALALERRRQPRDDHHHVGGGGDAHCFADQRAVRCRAHRIKTLCVDHLAGAGSSIAHDFERRLQAVRIHFRRARPLVARLLGKPADERHSRVACYRQHAGLVLEEHRRLHRSPARESVVGLEQCERLLHCAHRLWGRAASQPLL